MKKACIIFTLLMGIAFAGIAQQSSRLIAFSSWDYDTARQNLILRDTIDYTYSGSRGSDMKTGVYKYDIADIRTFGMGGFPPQPFNAEIKHLQTFDNNNNILTNTKQRFDGFTWYSAYKYSYEYYLNGLLKSEVEENGDGKGNLYPFMKNEYVYNPNGTVAYKLRYGASAHSFKLNDSTAYIYSGNQIQKEVTFDLDPVLSPWREIEYTYDISGNLSSDVQRRFQNGQWENYLRHDYIYNTDGTIASATMQSWLAPQGWRNSSLTFYGYDNNKNVILDSVLTWDFANNIWGNHKKTLSSYDANQNIIMQTEMNFNNGLFENNTRRTWTYNQHSQPVLFEPKGWNAASQVWEYKPFMPFGDLVKRYYYEEYNSIYKIAAADRIQAYPVPANNYLYVNIDIQNTGRFDIYLCDVAGRVVKTKINLPAKTTATVIPVSDLPAGVYVLKADVSGREYSQTILLAK